MSRTIRRKTKKIKSSSWILWDWNSPIGFMEYAFHTKDSKEGKKAIAVYHSDAGCGDLWYKSRAGWAKKIERKKYKRQCIQALNKYRKGTEEDCVLPTYKHGRLDSYKHGWLD